MFSKPILSKRWNITITKLTWVAFNAPSLHGLNSVSLSTIISSFELTKICDKITMIDDKNIEVQ